MTALTAMTLVAIGVFLLGASKALAGTFGRHVEESKWLRVASGCFLLIVAVGMFFNPGRDGADTVRAIVFGIAGVAVIAVSDRSAQQFRERRAGSPMPRGNRWLFALAGAVCLAVAALIVTGTMSVA